MSKSLGNVIDPLEVMDVYGTDAFRFTLAAFAAQGRDVKLSMKRIEGYRNFINKIWNSARFVLMNLEGAPPEVPAEDLSLADKWILSRLNSTTAQARETLDGYNFDRTASVLYQFMWHEFCDWYIELAKPALYGRKGDKAQAAARWTVLTALKDSLKLLHPIIPFVTEEIWSKLPGAEGQIMLASYPKPEAEREDKEAEKAMDMIQSVIVGIRNIRGEFNLPPTKPVKTVIFCPDRAAVELLEANEGAIHDLAWVEEVSASLPGEKPKSAAAAVAGEMEIFIPLAGLIDLEQEEARLRKDLDKVSKDLDKVSKKLGNPGFLAKAPAEVKAKVEGQRDEFALKKEKLESNLARVREMA